MGTVSQLRRSRGSLGPWSAARLLVLVPLLVLAGCGFHLRSYDLEASLDSVAVLEQGRNLLTEPLRRGLRQAGVEVASTAGGDVDATVLLLDDRRQRRSISVGGDARVAEYALLLGVRYRLLGADGAELAPARWAEVERIFQVDRDNIVGSSEEQALLDQEMQTDLVQQLLRALNAVAAASAPPAPA